MLYFMNREALFAEYKIENRENQLINHKSRSILQLMLMAFCAFQLASCSSTADQSPLLDAEPAMGAELTRAPRTLRLFYSSLPDVSQSSLKLTGPNGEHSLRGLHTMAADDLMIEILDPVTTGEYLVEWETVVEGDPTNHSGSFTFSVVDN